MAVLPRVRYFRATVQQQDGQEFIVALMEALKEVISDREMDQHEALLLVGTDKILECSAPQQHLSLKPQEVDEVLSLPVVHQDTGEPLVSVSSCLQQYLAREKVDRRCHVENCSSEEALQYSRISDTIPKVSGLLSLEVIKLDWVDLGAFQRFRKIRHNS